MTARGGEMMDTESTAFLVLLFLVSTLVNTAFAFYVSLRMGEFIFERLQRLDANALKRSEVSSTNKEVSS